jgi:hypothetical protein
LLRRSTELFTRHTQSKRSVQDLVKQSSRADIIHSQDLKALGKICLSGLEANLRKRLAELEPGTKLKWKRERVRGCRIVSNRPMVLPLKDYDDTVIRQVVVHIRSLQEIVPSTISKTLQPSIYLMQQGNKKRTRRMLAWTPDGEESALSTPMGNVTQQEEIPVRREMDEYMVLQKRILRGEEEKEWKVWGFLPGPTQAHEALKDSKSNKVEDEAQGGNEGRGAVTPA